MLTKELEKYIVYPKVKNTKMETFFELVKKNIIKAKKGERTRRHSLDVDRIVYGI